MIYTNKGVNIFSFFITLIIFLFINLIFFRNQKINIPEFPNIIDNIKEDIDTKKVSKENEVESLDLGNWYIEIPSINLKAPIAEGTGMDILNTKVGHFEDTAIENGNIGLAAHNRGYDYNFFEKLKNVHENDEIIYTHLNYKKIYLVDKNIIIENTNWDNLNKTEQNKITLITCVENEPKYRRCVQATEKGI